jgi:mannose-6-phosphate isomerase-like protein (cupin superfamily)
MLKGVRNASRTRGNNDVTVISAAKKGIPNMTEKPPAVLVTLQSTKRDPALMTRGDRKLLVTEVYKDKEEPAREALWTHAAPSGKCPVVLMPDSESAAFTQIAKQSRHYHKKGTEVYWLIEGVMQIEVEKRDYILTPGDTIVVNPGAFHEVKQEGPFLCRVVTLNCGGPSDRYET